MYFKSFEFVPILKDLSYKLTIEHILGRFDFFLFLFAFSTNLSKKHKYANQISFRLRSLNIYFRPLFNSHPCVTF